MSFEADNLTREEYNTQLLEDIRDLLRYMAMMFEQVHETGLELDDGEDLENGI